MDLSLTIGDKKFNPGFWLSSGIIGMGLEFKQLINFDYVDVLRNIAQYHHETIDGKGYPLGLKGNEIPLEARIVAVADVFDALTSARSYKVAWSNEKAIEALNELAGETLDKDCVDALIQNMDKVKEIQNQFQEDSIG